MVRQLLTEKTHQYVVMLLEIYEHQINRLSVWKVENQEDINDAIVALALNRDDVSKQSKNGY